MINAQHDSYSGRSSYKMRGETRRVSSEGGQLIIFFNVLFK